MDEFPGELELGAGAIALTGNSLTEARRVFRKWPAKAASRKKGV